VTAQTPNKLVQIKAKAIPLPEHISQFLELNAAEIKQMLKLNKVFYYFVPTFCSRSPSSSLFSLAFLLARSSLLASFV
jgi:hypothetical protein